MPVST